MIFNMLKFYSYFINFIVKKKIKNILLKKKN